LIGASGLKAESLQTKTATPSLVGDSHGGFVAPKLPTAALFDRS
jgi:hypothetical protein